MRKCETLIIRMCDILLAIIALIILSPILIFVMIILRFTGEREIFFIQERVGQNGYSFKLLKFATMLKASPNIGTGSITVKDDPRVLPFGKILRRTKINELPQLINVLLGDMSLVGPRPLTIENYNLYRPEVKLKIQSIRPGLSGIGSLVFRDEEKLLDNIETSPSFYETIITPYKGELEIWFVNNYGLYIYTMVIFTTVWVVLFPNSRIVWYMFRHLPLPPSQLKTLGTM